MIQLQINITEDQTTDIVLLANHAAGACSVTATFLVDGQPTPTEHAIAERLKSRLAKFLKPPG